MCCIQGASSIKCPLAGYELFPDSPQGCGLQHAFSSPRGVRVVSIRTRYIGDKKRVFVPSRGTSCFYGQTTTTTPILQVFVPSRGTSCFMNDLININYGSDRFRPLAGYELFPSTFGTFNDTKAFSSPRGVRVVSVHVPLFVDNAEFSSPRGVRVVSGWRRLPDMIFQFSSPRGVRVVSRSECHGTA